MVSPSQGQPRLRLPYHIWSHLLFYICILLYIYKTLFIKETSAFVLFFTIKLHYNIINFHIKILYYFLYIDFSKSKNIKGLLHQKFKVNYF